MSLVRRARTLPDKEGVEGNRYPCVGDRASSKRVEREEFNRIELGIRASSLRSLTRQMNTPAVVALTASIIGVAPTAWGVPDFTPARRLSGPLRALPSPTVVAWIDELLQISVSAAGAGRDIAPLRRSPIGTDLLIPAVARWRFQ